MLFLLFKNFMWAAWWPYYTMLLAMEKAAAQAAANRPKSPPQSPQAPPEPPSRPAPQPRPETQIRDRGVVRDEKCSMAANDAFMTPEMPQALRELMKMSIEQAMRAFETFVATSEKAWKSLETSPPNGRATIFALNAKIAEITRLNVEANFALAMKLAESKDVAQAMELQSQHVKKQMETFVHQLEEMRDLAAQIIQEANPASGGVRAASGSSNLHSASGPSSGYSSYAPSSSFTPGGEKGRTY